MEGDLKLAGHKDVIIKILKTIEEEFGQLKIDWHSFTDCGVRHCQESVTYEIILHQAEYIRGISVIVHPEFRARPSD